MLFFPMNYHATAVKNQLPVNVRVYFWTLSFVPLICMSSFMPVSYSRYYCIYVVEIEKFESYNFFLFDWFGKSGSLELLHKF